MQPYIQFQNISKAFAGVKALDSVSFGIRQGSIHALLGENGAGKSTLLKILSGYHTADSGSILIDGHEQKFASPLEARKAKISAIPQELQLIPNQTVAENITLGSYSAKFQVLNWQRMYAEVRSFLAEKGININERAKIQELGIGTRQLVEIAKAVYHRAKIVAFDEPTSSLSKFETDILFRIICTLKEQNVAIIYVSHRLSEVFALCDSCTILKDGKHVITRDEAQHNSDTAHLFSREQIISYMTGRKIENIYGYRTRTTGKEILNIQLGDRVSPALTARKGEIIGIFGLVGSGRSTLARKIYGKERPGSVKIRLDNKNINAHSPKKSIQNGLMFCTEDRKKDGIIPGRPIWENINISSRRHFCFLRSFLNKTREMAHAKSQIKWLRIQAAGLEQHIEYLSGGNQQKVILARWLSENGLKVLIVDEPTRGIDVGTKHEIYQILFTLAERGSAILVISSELPEVMGISDRLYVMRNRMISAEITRADFSEALILEHAFPQADKKQEP